MTSTIRIHTAKGEHIRCAADLRTVVSFNSFGYKYTNKGPRTQAQRVCHLTSYRQAGSRVKKGVEQYKLAYANYKTTEKRVEEKKVASSIAVPVVPVVVHSWA